jgi:hypothetical protein
MTLAGTASDDGSVVTVEYSFGSGEPFVAATGTDTWTADVDTSTADDGGVYISVRATDDTGATAYAFMTVIVDNAGPVVSIVNPTDGQIVSGIVPLIGTGDKVDSVEFRLDGGTWTDASNTVVWNYVLNTMTISEGDHLLEVRGIRDTPAATSDIVSIDFTVDQTVPSVVFNETDPNPASGDYLRDTVTFVGTSTDNNGVASVDYSTNGGTVWIPATGTTSWNFDLDTTDLVDGAYTIRVRAQDVTGLYGSMSIPVTLDNTIPVIAFTAPAASSVNDGVIHFTGTVDDDNINTVEIQFGSGSFIEANGSAWHLSTIDGGGSQNRGDYASLAIGPDVASNLGENSVHISYFDSVVGDLRYAYATSPSGTFSTEIADGDGLSGLFSAIALDSNNNPHIVHYNFSLNQMVYVYDTGSGWVSLTIPDTGIAYPATFPDIVITSTGVQYIVYPTSAGIQCASFIP